MANYGVATSISVSSSNALKQLKNLRKGIGDITGEIDKLGSKTSGKSLLGNMFSLKSIGGFISSIKDTIDIMVEASSAQTAYIENLNLLDTAYGTTENSGRELIQTLSDVVGLDQSGLTRSLGVYKQMTSALGLLNDTSALLSENLLKMQLDISSLYNLDFKRAGEILQVTLSGNTKSIRTLGGDITEATLQQTAWNLGIEKSIENMSRAEKSILIYLTIEQQLKNSQGDLAKTVNSVSNQVKIFQEQISMAGRQVGAIFIPILQALIPVLNGVLMAFNTVVSGFLSLLGIDATSIADQFGTATSEIEDYTGGISNNVGNATNSAKELSKTLRDFDKLHVIKTPTQNTSGGGTSGGGVSGIGEIDNSILEALKEYDLRLDNMNNKATEIRDKLLEWLEVFEVLKDPIERIASITYDGIIYLWENVLKPLGNWIAWESIPTAIETIAKGLDLIATIMEKSQPLYEFLFEEIFLPFARTIGKGIIDTLETIGDLLEFINKVPLLSNIATIATNLLLLYSAGSKIGNLFGVSKLGKTIKVFASTLKTATQESGSFLKGLKDTIQVALPFNSKMSTTERVLEGVKGTLKGITETGVGLALVSGSLQEMSDNGYSLGGMLGLLSGTFMTIVGTIQTVTSVVAVFNATLAANPILLVVTALAGLGIALGTMVSDQGKAKDSIEETNNALQEQKDRAYETADANLSLINRSEELAEELDGLVSSNGKVKKSDEDRVKVILGQLSKALGEEYELIDGVVYINGEAVDSYNEIKNSISRLIDEKKKESILSAYEEVYIQALKDRKKAYDELIKAREKGDSDAIARALVDYEKTTDLIESYENLMGATGKTINTSLNNFYGKVGLMTDKAVTDAENVVKNAQKSISGMTSKIEIKANTTALRPTINSSLSSPFSINLKPKQSTLNFTPVNTSSGNMTKYNISFKAAGGFPTSGDLFFANENGKPEYVGSMGGSSAVANQEQIVEGIKRATRQGFAEALMSSGINKNGSNPTKIIVEADENGLMNFIKFKTNENDRQYGM